MSALRLANAPVSFGAFELTVAGGFAVPDPEQVLAAIAGAGYEGTELGPVGYLGDADTLPERLGHYGLELVAGFVPVRFAGSEPDIEGQLLPVLDLGARPVLADAGPRQETTGPEFAERVQRAADLSRARGFDPVFHHHGGSNVETPEEIEELLDTTDLDLVLDTGHLVLGGGDPVKAVRDWGDRIAHVHVKDVRLEVLRQTPDMLERCRLGAFCELGQGDVDIDGFLSALTQSGYGGWLVVEQDRILESPDAIAEADAAQRRNRSWLEQHLEPLRA